MFDITLKIILAILLTGFTVHSMCTYGFSGICVLFFMVLFAGLGYLIGYGDGNES